ncbi:MAG: DUF6491 family protein [Gammaproteobacteria bacterium]
MSRSARLPLATIAFVLHLLGGCAAPGDGERPARVPIPPPSATGTSDCFYAREVQDFTALDRSNLIVYAPNDSNAYHVRISPPSNDLRFADSLAFLPPAGRICGYAGERLVVGLPASGQRFAIIDVSRLSRASLDMLRGGGEGGAEAATPRPQPGPGADVEGSGAPASPDEADNGRKKQPE